MPTRFGEPEPDFSRILQTLNNAGIQVKQPALYQTIQQLIKTSEAEQTVVNTAITRIDNSINDIINNIIVNISNGITELIGDVLAGPGTGTQVATLSTTGVVAGTYGDADNVGQFVVDAKGRISAAMDVPIATVAEDADILTWSDETADLPNSRQLLAGTNVSFDDTVPGERTVNVSAAAADYVVMSDGALPTPSPMNDGFGNFIYIAYTP